MRKLPVLAAFQHIWRSTTNNLPFAFHISWPWILILVPLTFGSNLLKLSSEDPMAAPTGYGAVSELVVGLFSIFAFASIAVAWHRYILKDEIPQGAARLRTDAVVWRYFGNTLKIFFVLLAVVVPIAIALGVLSWILGQLGTVISVPGVIALCLGCIAAFYRLSITLPAVALGDQDFTLSKAWAATAGNNWQIIGLGLLLFAVVLAIALAAALVGALIVAVPGIGVLAFTIFQVLVTWAVTIVSVTTLTSLYGFFVQSRDF